MPIPLIGLIAGAGRAAVGGAARVGRAAARFNLGMRVRGLRKAQQAMSQVEQAVSVGRAARTFVRTRGGARGASMSPRQAARMSQPARARATGRGMRWAIEQIGKDVLRTSGSMTHIDTGALRASHRMEFSSKGKTARALIFIDPTAVNPRTGRRVAEYGFYEHARGGSHAFYGRTFDFYRRGGGRRFLKYIRQQLP